LTGFVVLALTIVGGALVLYLFLRKPAAAPPSSVRVEITPARLARGQFIFERLADCDGCHSQRDFTRFGGPVIPSGRGAGTVFPAQLGLPGTVVAPNITPDRETGLGNWSDGEKIRAIREGIGRDGRALFPMMPYGSYRRMSDEDVYSVVAYLNQLPPVRNPLPRTRLNFPVSVLIKSAPQPAGSVSGPDRGNKLEYGRYLVALGGCMDCHTPMQKGQPQPGMLLAGGRRFSFPGSVVLSANITPDADTGIGKWSEQDFLDRFYQYQDYVRFGPPKTGPESFTLMPWLGLSQLPPEDLKAIYAFLKSQKAVYNAVETHPLGVASNFSPSPTS
jgi:mono/diheme cytochrome c family protein